MTGVQTCAHPIYDAEVQQVGVEWCIQQCKELKEHGVPSIHFYSIGAIDSIREVAKAIY